MKNFGIDTIEMTGGEVTIRPDFLDLVSYAKDHLRYQRISVITNGSRFCDEGFAKEAIKRGVDDVIVSVHGHNAELHDRLTERKGSFEEAMASARNIFRFGATCRTNTVINELNYRHAIDIAETIRGMGVKKINYIFFSPLDDASETQKELWPRYSDAAPYVKKMIDQFRGQFDAISIKVIPFCFMEGYENFVTDFWQNLYDPFEWDFYNRVRIRRGLFIRTIAVLVGLLFFMDISRMRRIGLKKSLSEAIARVQSFRESAKSAVCRSCKYDRVCPGVWKDYAKRFGLEELRSISGKKIDDVEFSVRERFNI